MEFVKGDMVEYIAVNGSTYHGIIEKCVADTCKFRVTDAAYATKADRLYKYEVGEIMEINKKYLRHIGPRNINHSHKKQMIGELAALPEIRGLFPGGVNYLSARNRVRRNRLNRLVQTLPEPPPGAKLFGGRRRTRRMRRSRKHCV